jgi:hypothetical protein
MLTIRREQFDAFARAPRIQFENRLITHCVVFFPDECRAMGTDRTRKLAQDAIELSTEQGFPTEREIAYFLSLIFSLGVEFYCDPQLPWNFDPIRGSRLIDRAGTIDGIFSRAMKYLDDIAGPNNRNLVRAIVRVRNFDFAKVPTLGARFEFDVCGLLKTVFPEKFAYQGEGVTRTIIQAAILQAGTYGIEDNQGLACYAALMFMLGSGMHKDPIYGWAGEILDAAPPSSLGESKGQQLFLAALKHLRESLGEEN